MPTCVNPDKCDGCRALDRPACAYICPMDLMKLDLATAKYRDGRVKRFKLAIRSTEWGSIEPFPDDGRPGEMDVKSPALFGEDKYLGVDRLPVPGAR